MSRLLAATAVLALLCVPAQARQLVAPNFNPGLKTVPWINGLASANPAACERALAARIDSGTVILGADGRVAHVTGMGSGVGGELVIAGVAADGRSAVADFLTCASPAFVTPAPVSASLPLSDARVQSLSVRSQANSIVLPVGN